ncbi:hypothetical protein HFO98_31140 [Rhizobium leguminosarum]|nr:hypothetical protein [Rhizobium leguminosarum]MBY5412804.1 hypothetical protein [Rhizobium leguminosarum]
MSHEFRPGEVISYPYLWAWQQQRGETEGRKQRPSPPSSPSAMHEDGIRTVPIYRVASAWLTATPLTRTPPTHATRAVLGGAITGSQGEVSC